MVQQIKNERLIPHKHSERAHVPVHAHVIIFPASSKSCNLALLDPVPIGIVKHFGRHSKPREGIDRVEPDVPGPTVGQIQLHLHTAGRVSDAAMVIGTLTNYRNGKDNS
jgi:hypothetical protein